VVKLELQLARSGSPCVYFQELQMDKSGKEAVGLDNMGIKRNICQLKWSESILAYRYPSIFYSASAGMLC
jgi:hypothetical protein